MNIKKYQMCMIFLAITCFLFNTISFAYTDTLKSYNQYNETVILNEDEQEILDLINNIRVNNGLAKLKINSKLQAVAKLKAEDIINNEYFSHTSPTYGTPFNMMNMYGIEYKTAGENLAGNITSEKACEAWMNSESHKSNIMDTEFEYTAICVLDSEIYGKVFVQMFMGEK